MTVLLVVSDSNDVASSQGVFNSKYDSTNNSVTQVNDPVFNVAGTNVRRVEPRNTPSVINAVFNFRNFWDGRAQNVFNGVDPFGTRNPNAKVYKANSLLSPLTAVSVQLKNSSLASQAVGPPLSAFEMSADGRTFEEIGDQFGSGLLDNLLGILKTKKLLLPRDLAKNLLPLKPLAKQIVDSEDSVLDEYRSSTGKGLKVTYKQMIKDAFKPEWWQSTQLVQVDKANGNTRKVVLLPDLSSSTEEYTQLEYNFSLFFGLAVQMYESTLVSDNAPIDQYLDNPDKYNKDFGDTQKRGLDLFQNKFCIGCHAGAEFTAASVRNVQNNGRLTRSLAPGNPIEDTGFFKIGVTPELEDLGVGGEDGQSCIAIAIGGGDSQRQRNFQKSFW